MIRPIIPMEPVFREDVFQSDQWLYQIKWDGVRMLAFREEKEIELYNRKGRRRTHWYPEVTEAVRRLDCRSAVLDGEIIALEEGRPDFFRVLKRELLSDSRKLPSLIQKVPIQYIVFDLLYLDGEELTGKPLRIRLEALSHLFDNGGADPLHLCDSFDDGPGLWEVTGERGWEGIVMKEREGRYHPGRKHPTWQKAKHFQSLTATAVGALYRGNVVHSLLLGMWDNDRWIYIGRAGSGLSGEERRMLTNAVPSLRRESPPVANPPKGRNPGVVWMEPLLRMEVKFLEWTPHGTLRSPVIVGFRLPEK
ncbi:bifunctional non-homologous end joining protein LigD [Melghirimyces profundicolus]|uniref:DNA ligase (ATP) n=1 Tax=Melghirimyces profundicolus TaxID=1242148 RepID=A0A2T6BV50_9BACL|nr:non-homologous end-joining DNA ligase [Melghirimyces profundicolus]PTX59943.1 bifunctional non-homologous end joining protein LigD [Melghirimyces profundicolus]